MHHEFLVELERNTMALMANLQRDPNKTSPFSGKDFYKLSYDEVVQESKPTGEEMFKVLSERFKNKPLRSGK
jgi:hypothetical protein